MVQSSAPELGSRTIEIIPYRAELYSFAHPPHPLTGKNCENYGQRPYAVMMPEDTATRPLSGISKADMVIEMQVVKGSITRMMAFFACEQPEEIGSIRSARHDFIPLAAAFDAIFVHWGGSSFALDDVKSSRIDNINALINPNNVFYRKQGIRAPHNGFTTFNRMQETAELLGYSTTTSFSPYLREPERPLRSSAGYSVKISYPRPFNLEYTYQPQTNSYQRFRGGTPEYDALNNEQAEVKVVIVMRTTSRQLNADYNDVDVTGEGEALIFQNGRVTEAQWQRKEATDSRLRFLDERGRDIPLVAGSVWLHIVDTDTSVTFE